LPSKQVGQGGRSAAIRYVNKVDAGHHLEEFAGDMAAGPVADTFSICPLNSRSSAISPDVRTNPASRVLSKSSVQLFERC